MSAKDKVNEKDIKEIVLNDSKSTLDYYNHHYGSFIENTVEAPMNDIHERFIGDLPEGATILDLGCGSGRDSKIFKDLGYVVVATDGSPQICEKASELIGHTVICRDFMELDEQDTYDGIWACASILHLPSQELPRMLKKIVAALKNNGIFYVSFKRGTFEGWRNGRYFTDLTESSLQRLIDEASSIKVEEMFITSDVRLGREKEQWLNCIGRVKK